MSKTVSDLSNIIFEYYPSVRRVFRGLVSIKGVPISMTQLTCLNILYKNNNLNMSDLAEKLDMSSQQLTKVMDALEDFGMAQRITSDTNHRVIYATITEKGNKTIESLRNELDTKLGKLLNKKSDNEIDSLYDSISDIAKYFVHKV